MALVECVAVRWVSDDEPGWVEVQLTDADGAVWIMVDKEPVFGDESLTSDADYPRPLLLACDVVSAPSAGVAEVALRHGVESSEGASRFVVPSASVHDG
jgi:hypothetical protein